MSYALRSDRGYRMPTHFGPLPGPRQAPTGGPHALDTGERSTLIWASFGVDADQLASLLPDRFEPATDPDITVEIKNMTNIGWLAGRGYSVATITAGVRRTMNDDHPRDGRFKLILWENEADPIITGREELGYPKVYGEVSTIQEGPDGGSATAAVSWDGFTFLELEVTDLTDQPLAAPGGASFHTKYIPRTGTAGGHDVVQTILTSPGQGPLEVLERRSGTGDVRFTAGTWQQLPTLVTIVATLADLRLGAVRGAGLARTLGMTDLRDQLVIAEH